MVYVIEDDPDTREILAEVLRFGGFLVELARSAEEGLERLRAGFRPSVVLLDLYMPVLDGAQFLEELRRDDVQVPVVVVTAAHPRHHPVGCPVLLKPFDVEHLFSMLRQLAA